VHPTAPSYGVFEGAGYGRYIHLKDCCGGADIYPHPTHNFVTISAAGLDIYQHGQHQSTANN
jgi:hypothetical protein